MSRARAALLGLDLGTSSLKALLLGLDGRVIGERRAPYPTHAPHPGWAEQDPDDWWEAAGVATRELLAAMGADHEVVSIGLAGQMHTFVLVDADGRAVRPAITWMDTRAQADVGTLAATIAGAGVAEELANPVVLGLTLPPFAWLRDHEPEALARAATLLLAKDALRARLVGTLASEPTDASATLLFDVSRRRWSAATMAALGLPASLLPDLGACDALAGVLTPAAARHLGLPVGVPVAFGAGDTQAAAVGTGCLEPGDTQLTVGTGAQALVVTGAPPPGGFGGGLHAFCHARGWIAQASVHSAGLALEWARAVLGMSWEDLYGTLGDAAPRGAPLFLPYLSGERVPLHKAHARGGWLGVAVHHDRVDLARAAVAAVVTAVADGLLALPGGMEGPVRAAGGGLGEPTFAQAVADASGRALHVLPVASASAVGAAIMGGVAGGAFAGVEEAVAVVRGASEVTHVQPRVERATTWATLRERVRQLDAMGLHEMVDARDAR